MGLILGDGNTSRYSITKHIGGARRHRDCCFPDRDQHDTGRNRLQPTGNLDVTIVDSQVRCNCPAWIATLEHYVIGTFDAKAPGVAHRARAKSRVRCKSLGSGASNETPFPSGNLKLSRAACRNWRGEIDSLCPPNAPPYLL